jgi:hypothetical protein
LREHLECGRRLNYSKAEEPHQLFLAGCLDMPVRDHNKAAKSIADQNVLKMFISRAHLSTPQRRPSLR